MSSLITREYNASPAGKGQVFTFRGDGWFNMTKAAQAFGKEVKEFLHPLHPGVHRRPSKGGKFPRL